jgi:hypothetical protein
MASLTGSKGKLFSRQRVNTPACRRPGGRLRGRWVARSLHSFLGLDSGISEVSERHRPPAAPATSSGGSRLTGSPNRWTNRREQAKWPPAAAGSCGRFSGEFQARRGNSFIRSVSV